MKKLVFTVLLTLNLFGIDTYDFDTYSQKQLFKKELTPAEAFELKARGVIFIDVRSKNEYDYSHILGSFWIPIYFDKYGKRVFNRNFVEQVEEILDGKKDAKMILVSKRGDRSRYASNILFENGFKNVYSLKNGFLGKDGWYRSGYQYWKAPQYYK